MRNVVVNTTPIISLCIINQLHLLKDLYNEIYIPQAVYKELCAKEDSKTKHALEKSLNWVKIQKIENELAKALYKSQLHDGEVEVMILGKEIHSDLLVIDDKNAKRHAKYLGFSVTGTLGVLLKAKRESRIQAIKPLINQLISSNIYIDTKTIEFCLRESNE